MQLVALFAMKHHQAAHCDMKWSLQVPFTLKGTGIPVNPHRLLHDLVSTAYFIRLASFGLLPGPGFMTPGDSDFQI
jgi:hypothetical protein